MDLINIIRTPREIPASEHKSCTILLESKFTLQSFSRTIEEQQEQLKAQGFTLFVLEFGVRHYEDGDTAPTVTIHEARMETEEEAQARVKQQAAYNAREIRSHLEKLDNIAKRKEIERILGGLTLEQLQALPAVDKE